MQILFLTNQPGNFDQIRKITDYPQSLSQNILLATYEDIYTKNQLIYAKQCLVLNKMVSHEDVLLSPSLIIDLTHGFNLDKYLIYTWMNCQQAFHHLKNARNLFQPKLNIDKSLSHCICYTPNLDTPRFKIVMESLEISSDENKSLFTGANCKGPLEQTITEFFAAKNYFKKIETDYEKAILNHRSAVFYIQFSLHEVYADVSFEIASVNQLDMFQLLDLNQDFLFQYLDDLQEYRMNRFIEQVTFRKYIIDLCQEHDVDFEPSYFRTFVLTQGDKIGLQRSYFGGVNDKDGIATVQDKHRTNVFLKKKGFKVNTSHEYSLYQLNSKKAIQELPLNYPLVLKPTDKREGYGVVTNILNPERMLHSVKKLIKMEDIDPVLVEEFFVGITYRVMVISGQVKAVLKFIPASITGDGKTQIDDLIRAKNLVSRSRIRINNSLRLSVFNDGNNWETILPDGERYILSYNSHASLGGQATNVTELFKEEYKVIAAQVCESLNIKYAGIDMIVNQEGDYRILEVNCAPALSTHLKPKYGTSIDTYTLVLNCLLNDTDLSKPENSYLLELVKYHQ